jgi:hypothetical protein
MGEIVWGKVEVVTGVEVSSGNRTVPCATLGWLVVDRCSGLFDRSTTQIRLDLDNGYLV